MNKDDAAVLTARQAELRAEIDALKAKQREVANAYKNGEIAKAEIEEVFVDYNRRIKSARSEIEEIAFKLIDVE